MAEEDQDGGSVAPEVAEAHVRALGVLDDQAGEFQDGSPLDCAS
jgi:hypothetical protein